jgi:hypothetical protein
MIKEATGVYWGQLARNYAQRIQKRDLDAFFGWDTLDPPIEDAERRKRFWSNALTSQRIERTPKSYEMKITECLWAQTFREAHAADLGFATICYQDEAMAAAFDPRLKLTRTKTLMKGRTKPYQAFNGYATGFAANNKIGGKIEKIHS